MRSSKSCDRERDEVSHQLSSLPLIALLCHSAHREVVETDGNQGYVRGGGVYEEATQVREVHTTNGTQI